jgi:hypothetical protein
MGEKHFLPGTTSHGERKETSGAERRGVEASQSREDCAAGESKAARARPRKHMGLRMVSCYFGPRCRNPQCKFDHGSDDPSAVINTRWRRKGSGGSGAEQAGRRPRKEIRVCHFGPCCRNERCRFAHPERSADSSAASSVDPFSVPKRKFRRATELASTELSLLLDAAVMGGFVKLVSQSDAAGVEPHGAE